MVSLRLGCKDDDPVCVCRSVSSGCSQFPDSLAQRMHPPFLLHRHKRCPPSSTCCRGQSWDQLLARNFKLSSGNKENRLQNEAVRLQKEEGAVGTDGCAQRVENIKLSQHFIHRLISVTTHSSVPRLLRCVRSKHTRGGTFSAASRLAGSRPWIPGSQRRRCVCCRPLSTSVFPL